MIEVHYVRIATWNLNNRVGKKRFRPEAAHAAIGLGAAVVVFTEYFPRQYHDQFCQVLADAGLANQLISEERAELANRTLIVSRHPLEKDKLELPDFDHQFPSNIVAAVMPTIQLRIIGLRVPWYASPNASLRLKAWRWIESAAASRRNTPTLITGDLNVTTSISRGAVGKCFLRIRKSGWQAAVPVQEHSYFGHRGRQSAVDHLLSTPHCRIVRSEYVTSVLGFTLAGTKDSLSDHAALTVDLEVNGTIPNAIAGPRA